MNIGTLLIEAEVVRPPAGLAGRLVTAHEGTGTDLAK
ncbi:hypothetical protein BSG1_16890 [Bacillus sp. SG-1]|nr:hypothetical protein BSG1_16890 [Bacillus sp. SG-1]